jgi:flavin reductase (DIM6/NTAB) family NADH-FMN oxidoreductase RutF
VKKVTQGPMTSFYPLPTLLIGAMVDGKPNVMTAVYGGLANGKPPMLSVGIVRSRYTWNAIKVGAVFSVNIPSASQAREIDYCGVESGSKADKIAKCGFTVFYGDLKTAPLIEECPINLECVAAHILDFDMHSLVVADIKQTHVSEECLTDGVLDPMKVDPMVFLTAPARKYVRIGEVLGDAFKMGLELK